MTTRRTSTQGPSDIQVRTTIASFERAFSTVDAAVGGALLAGIHPYAFEPVLSYWFLHMAATSRNHSKQKFQTWMAQPGLIFDPIMRRVEEFCHSFDGELEDLGEEEELHLLAEKCLKGNFHSLSEFDQQRHSKNAVGILEWIILC